MLNRLDDNAATALYIAVVMACGFITFYSLPDVVPFSGRLTMMVVLQLNIGVAVRRAQEDMNDES